MNPFFKFFVLLFLMMPLLVKSQQDTKAVFLSINKQASSIDEALLKINTSLKKDRHKDAEQQTHDIEIMLASIEKQSNALALETAKEISSITGGFKTDMDDFEKLLHKSKLFDNDKALISSLTSLKSRLGQLREFLRSAYSSFLIAGTGKENVPSSSPDSSQTITVQSQTPSLEKQTTTVQAPQHDSSLSATEEPIANPPGRSNPVILAQMREAAEQVAAWIDTLQIAVKKSQYVKIAMLAKNVAAMAAKIADLSLLVEDDQKNNIKTLAAGLKKYAEDLHELSHKGLAVHEQMHETIDLMQTRSGVLSTGISILK